MNPRHLGLIAAILFPISFVLPAYGEHLGWECLRICWGEIFDYQPTDFGAGLYYPAFVLTNALFVVLIVPAVRTKRLGPIPFMISVAALAHVLSWLALNLWHRDPGEKFEIKIGYFVWLIAYLLLSTSLFRLRKNGA